MGTLSEMLFIDISLESGGLLLSLLFEGFFTEKPIVMMLAREVL